MHVTSKLEVNLINTTHSLQTNTKYYYLDQAPVVL